MCAPTRSSATDSILYGEPRPQQNFVGRRSIRVVSGRAHLDFERAFQTAAAAPGFVFRRDFNAFAASFSDCAAGNSRRNRHGRSDALGDSRSVARCDRPSAGQQFFADACACDFPLLRSRYLAGSAF
jgi:hypothetical protein